MEISQRDEIIGRNLAALRGGMSQQALADQMREHGFKWSQATVWSIEKGERPLRLAEAESLSGIIGAAVVDLLKMPQWHLVADAIAAVHKSRADMLEAANALDYALGILAGAADSLVAAGGDASDEVDGVQFDASPVEILAADWEGRRHGSPAAGIHSATYLSRPELLHPALNRGADGKHQTKA